MKLNVKQYLTIFEEAIPNKKLCYLILNFYDTFGIVYNINIDFEDEKIYTSTIDEKTQEIKNNGGIRLNYSFGELFDNN